MRVPDYKRMQRGKLKHVPECALEAICAVLIPNKWQTLKAVSEQLGCHQAIISAVVTQLQMQRFPIKKTARPPSQSQQVVVAETDLFDERKPEKKEAKIAAVSFMEKRMVKVSDMADKREDDNICPEVWE